MPAPCTPFFFFPPAFFTRFFFFGWVFRFAFFTFAFPFGFGCRCCPSCWYAKLITFATSDTIGWF